MILDSLCLTYFTQHNFFHSHPCCYKSWVFILSDGGIIPIVYMDHIFLIHSSVEGHLGSFHSLVTVGIAAINIGVQMALLFRTSVSLG